MQAQILTEQLDRDLATRSLYDFIQLGAWDVLEPGTTYVDGWHIYEVCCTIQAELEDWASGDPKLAQDSVINVPPGTMKSLIVSVFAPAWFWLRYPHWRAIYGSANPRVALRDSVKCRDLIESEWYQKSFRPKWKLADDQNAKSYYKTTEGGFRQAVTVGQKIVGDRADFLGVDDPLDPTDAESSGKAARDAVMMWWNQAFYNRVNDPQRSKRLVIMQRLHEEDLAGFMLKDPLVGRLILPMEFVPERKDPRDRRTQPGELLCPARYPETVLVQERKRLGTWGYAGQMQQDPVPAGGGMFPPVWWKFWTRHTTPVSSPRPDGCNSFPPKRLPESFDAITISVDATFKDAATSDYVSITVWGRSKADSFLLGETHDRMGFKATCDAIRKWRASFPTAMRILIEDKANGSAIIETLKTEFSGVIAINPEGGKEARAAACQPEIESGNVYLPEGMPWTGEYVAEFSKFPKGANDDRVDSTTQYLIWEKNSGLRRIAALCSL